MSFTSSSLLKLGRSTAPWSLASSVRYSSSSSSTLAAAATPTTTVPSSSTPSQALKATHYRITLRRSAIGMPKKINKTLVAIGLKKRLQSVYRPISPEIAGSILAVKELVHVDNVQRLDTADQIGLRDGEAAWVNEADEIVDPGKAGKKAPRGYKVIGNMVDELRDQNIKSSQNA